MRGDAEMLIELLVSSGLSRGSTRPRAKCVARARLFSHNRTRMVVICGLRSSGGPTISHGIAWAPPTPRDGHFHPLGNWPASVRNLSSFGLISFCVSAHQSTNWQELAISVRAAESGSFSRAARELGLSQPSVTRIMSESEARLGVKLLLRTTRSITVTDAGALNHGSLSYSR